MRHRQRICWAVVLSVSFSLIPPDTHTCLKLFYAPTYSLTQFLSPHTHAFSYTLAHSHTRTLAHSHTCTLAHSHPHTPAHPHTRSLTCTGWLFYHAHGGRLLWKLCFDALEPWRKHFFDPHILNRLIQNHGKQNLKGLKRQRKDWGSVKF